MSRPSWCPVCAGSALTLTWMRTYGFVAEPVAWQMYTLPCAFPFTGACFGCSCCFEQSPPLYACTSRPCRTARPCRSRSAQRSGRSRTASTRPPSTTHPSGRWPSCPGRRRWCTTCCGRSCCPASGPPAGRTRASSGRSRTSGSGSSRGRRQTPPPTGSRARERRPPQLPQLSSSFHLVPIWVSGCRKARYKRQTPRYLARVRGGLLEVVVRGVILGGRSRLRPLDERDGEPLDPVPLHLEHVEAEPVVRDVV